MRARVLAEGGEEPGALTFGVFLRPSREWREGKPRVTAHYSLGGPYGRSFLISLGLNAEEESVSKFNPNSTL